MSGGYTGMRVRKLHGRALVIVVLAALTVATAWGSNALAAPTTWTVTTTADGSGTCSISGPCTLRQAIDSAGAGDTVVVPASPSGYELTGGAISVTHAITIQGAGANTTTVVGDGTELFVLDAASGTTTIDGLTFTNGSDDSGAGAGAINIESATVDLNDDAIVGNTEHGPVSGAGFGGGISVDSGATLNGARLLIEGNNVSTTADSSDAWGGGVDNNGTTTIVDSTIVGNSASATGASGSDAFGGGVASGAGTVALINDTLAGNSVSATTTFDEGGNLETNSTSETSFRNTIIVGGTASSAATNCYVGAGIGFTSLGGNIENTTGQCAIGSATGDKDDTDPKLGSLGKHGGPTETIPLLSGSPAILATSNCAGGVDQRGEPRGTTCSIGAFEPQAPSLSVSTSATSEPLGTSFTFTATATDSDPTDPVVVTWRFDDGATATGTSVTHAFTSPGPHTATATAVDALALATSQTATVTVIGPPTILGATLALQQPKPRHKKVKAKPFSADLTFSLDQVASVSATVTQTLSGKRRHGRCQAARIAKKHRAPCPTSRQIESFTIAGQAGANSFTFPGGSATKRPGAGHYTLALVATGTANQQSQTVSLTFSVR